MKWQIIFPAWLLLCTLTAFVSCAEDIKIKVKTVSDGIELSCPDSQTIVKSGTVKNLTLPLKYKDENSGEYHCLKPDNDGQHTVAEKIYVKFRTCDNCVELDLTSIIGIVAGDVVATTVIGVAVYLFVSQNRIRPVTSNKKSSDRQHLVPNEMSSSSRAPNDHYQPLKHKGGQKETYDVLANRR